MSDEEQIQFEDEMRLCPVCRMSISVWATRCRFCGEEVGRPKREEKKLTLRDLGVPQNVSYKQSEEVRNALEAFRKELAHSSHAPGLGHKDNLPDVDINGLPELDNDARALLENSYSPAKQNQTQSTHRGNSQSDLLRLASLIVGLSIGVVAALYMLTAGYKALANYMGSEPPAETMPDYNRAMEMLAGEEGPIAALEEALRALRYHDTAENRAIADQVRQHLEAEVTRLLHQEPWRKSNFDRASALASQAAVVDSHAQVRQLHNLVRQEIAAYKMVLRSIDVEAETATFILNNPYVEDTEQVVREGEYVQGRFLVASIASREVRLLDSRYESDRGYRRLVCRVLEPMSSP